MPRFLVVATPGKGPDPAPLRWLKLPDAGLVRVREATAGLEAVEADPDFEPEVRKRDSTRLIPPPATGLAPGERPLRIELASSFAGVTARLVESKERPPAPVADLDQGFHYATEPRSVAPGRVLGARPESATGLRIVLVTAEGAGDAPALARALAGAASELDALAEPLVREVVNARTRSVGDPLATLLPWRRIELALRELRDLRAPFRDALPEEERQAVERAWEQALHRILGRSGLASPVPLNDRIRDWFAAVRAPLERIHGFPRLHRDAFALGVARALEALGEPPATVRVVPLGGRERRESFALTLSTPGSPEYRIFDVKRTDAGDAVVSGRRVKVAPEALRVHAARCVCGGRLYERDEHCRGCGQNVASLGKIQIGETFALGATAAAAAICECGMALGAEDRFCGGCGRSLEDWV